MPSINPLSSLFGHSAIGTIQAHMPGGEPAAGDPEKVRHTRQRPLKTARDADQLKRSPRRHLREQLFLFQGVLSP
jgi:hypothetical protein